MRRAAVAILIIFNSGFSAHGQLMCVSPKDGQVYSRDPDNGMLERIPEQPAALGHEEDSDGGAGGGQAPSPSDKRAAADQAKAALEAMRAAMEGMPEAARAAMEGPMQALQANADQLEAAAARETADKWRDAVVKSLAASDRASAALSAANKQALAEYPDGIPDEVQAKLDKLAAQAEEKRAEADNLKKGYGIASVAADEAEHVALHGEPSPAGATATAEQTEERAKTAANKLERQYGGAASAEQRALNGEPSPAEAQATAAQEAADRAKEAYSDKKAKAEQASAALEAALADKENPPDNKILRALIADANQANADANAALQALAAKQSASAAAGQAAAGDNYLAALVSEEKAQAGVEEAKAALASAPGGRAFQDAKEKLAGAQAELERAAAAAGAAGGQLEEARALAKDAAERAKQVDDYLAKQEADKAEAKRAAAERAKAVRAAQEAQERDQAGREKQAAFEKGESDKRKLAWLKQLSDLDNLPPEKAEAVRKALGDQAYSDALDARREAEQARSAYDQEKARLDGLPEGEVTKEMRDALEAKRHNRDWTQNEADDANERWRTSGDSPEQARGEANRFLDQRAQENAAAVGDAASKNREALKAAEASIAGMPPDQVTPQMQDYVNRLRANQEKLDAASADASKVVNDRKEAAFDRFVAENAAADNAARFKGMQLLKGPDGAVTGVRIDPNAGPIDLQKLVGTGLLTGEQAEQLQKTVDDRQRMSGGDSSYGEKFTTPLTITVNDRGDVRLSFHTASSERNAASDVSVVLGGGGLRTNITDNYASGRSEKYGIAETGWDADKGGFTAETDTWNKYNVVKHDKDANVYDVEAYRVAETSSRDPVTGKMVVRVGPETKADNLDINRSREFRDASATVGKGAVDLIAAAGAEILAYTPAYRALVWVTGGDVNAAVSDLHDRAKADFYGNAVSKELGKKYASGYEGGVQALQVDSSKNVHNVGKEMAGLGYAQTGAVLQGGVNFADSQFNPENFLFMKGVPALGNLGTAGKLAQLGVEAKMNFDAVSGAGQSVDRFVNASLKYNEKDPASKAEYLAALTGLTEQGLGVPMLPGLGEHLPGVSHEGAGLLSESTNPKIGKNLVLDYDVGQGVKDVGAAVKNRLGFEAPAPREPATGFDVSKPAQGTFDVNARPEGGMFSEPAAPGGKGVGREPSAEISGPEPFEPTTTGAAPKKTALAEAPTPAVQTGETGGQAPSAQALAGKAFVVDNFLKTLITEHPDAAQAIAHLQNIPEGKMGELKVRFESAPGELPADTAAWYDPNANEIVFSQSLKDVPTHRLVETLAHETQHAYDETQVDRTLPPSVENEARAHEAQVITRAVVEERMKGLNEKYAGLAEFDINKTLDGKPITGDNPTAETYLKTLDAVVEASNGGRKGLTDYIEKTYQGQVENLDDFIRDRRTDIKEIAGILAKMDKGETLTKKDATRRDKYLAEHEAAFGAETGASDPRRALLEMKGEKEALRAAADMDRREELAAPGPEETATAPEATGQPQNAATGKPKPALLGGGNAGQNADVNAGFLKSVSEATGSDAAQLRQEGLSREGFDKFLQDKGISLKGSKLDAVKLLVKQYREDILQERQENQLPVEQGFLARVGRLSSEASALTGEQIRAKWAEYLKERGLKDSQPLRDKVTTEMQKQTAALKEKLGEKDVIEASGHSFGETSVEEATKKDYGEYWAIVNLHGVGAETKLTEADLAKRVLTEAQPFQTPDRYNAMVTRLPQDRVLVHRTPKGTYEVTAFSETTSAKRKADLLGKNGLVDKFFNGPKAANPDFDPFFKFQSATMKGGQQRSEFFDGVEQFAQKSNRAAAAGRDTAGGEKSGAEVSGPSER